MPTRKQTKVQQTNTPAATHNPFVSLMHKPHKPNISLEARQSAVPASPSILDNKCWFIQVILLFSSKKSVVLL